MSAEVLGCSTTLILLKFFLRAPDTYTFHLKKVLARDIEILITDKTGEIIGVSEPPADWLYIIYIMYVLSL